MGDWPVYSHHRVQTTPVTGDLGAEVAGGGSANSKGAWVELIASTSFTAVAVYVSVVQFTASNAPLLLDIGVGGSGSERVLVPDLINSAGQRAGGGVTTLPLTVPAGSRLSARLACATGSAFAWVHVHLVGGGFSQTPGLQAVTAYGVTAASSRGTAVAGSATSTEVKGAWTQITAATTGPIRALTPRVGFGGNANPADAPFRLDIGVGAAAAEQVIIPDLLFYGTSGGSLVPAGWPAFPVDIPEGSRLAARVLAGVTDATDRQIDVIIYGLS